MGEWRRRIVWFLQGRRHQWDVPEPLPERVRHWTAVHVICPTRGHVWMAKMYDDVCMRCRTSRRRAGR